jgi:hypothetical protein
LSQSGLKHRDVAAATLYRLSVAHDAGNTVAQRQTAHEPRASRASNNQMILLCGHAVIQDVQIRRMLRRPKQAYSCP